MGRIPSPIIGGVVKNDTMADGNDRTPFDAALASLAERQHGAVSLVQLEALGMGASGVRMRTSAGKLHRIHRGVYTVGHSLLTMKGRWMAAVLACGEGAVLSHRSAAELSGLHRFDRQTIDVTTAGRTGRGRKGIDAHSARDLRRSDVTAVSDIPCTTVPRTLLDIAEVVNRRILERAINRAEILRVFDLGALEEVLSRADGRRGVAALRAVLDEYTDPAITRSELEELVLAMCSQFGIRKPLANQWIALKGGTFMVDFVWQQERFVLEADGRHVHGSRRAFEHDRERDQRLMLAGYRVMRCTWRQVINEPTELAARIAKLLAAA
jgi:predicted transcriptional regulator of viral defense system